MGFLLRSAFWLGIVYSAMPLDVASLAPTANATAPVAVSALCPPAGGAPPSCLGVPLSACNVAAAALCPRLREVAAEQTPAPDKRRRPSADTLTPGDRAPPWKGPPSRSQG